jgi:myo-inositol-1(or 4)-monophosphatase|tara:strand:+ start:277 stop:1050 length:774 start_codon:yes stop_codon:yes gene_type:complete
MLDKKFFKPINESLKELSILFNKKINRQYKTKKDFQIDPVTKLDIKSEQIIKKKIFKYFPDHNIIGEECEDKVTASQYTWVIDPIDGTKSMIMGLPTWSNLIGLYKNEECILSWANFPELNKYYIAYDNKSFVFQNKKLKKIQANKGVTFKNAKLTINTLHSLRRKKVFKYIMSFKGFFKVTGVDAYNFCSIAEGKFDVLIESGLKIVDILPILLIVQNSGAIITDWQGKNDFSKGQVLVSPNIKIHNYFLKILKKA